MSIRLNFKMYAASALCISLLGACGGSGGDSPAISEQSQTLSKSITEKDLSDEIAVVDSYAAQSGEVPTREEGSTGLEEARNYLADEFEKLGFDVSEDPFSYRVWKEGTSSLDITGLPQPTTFNYKVLERSAGGIVAETELVVLDATVYIPNTPFAPDHGCNIEDFQNAGVIKDKIVLVQAGGCTLEKKLTLAQDAEAAGLIVFKEKKDSFSDNEVFSEPLPYRLSPLATIPVLGISYQDGINLYSYRNENDFRAAVSVNVEDTLVETKNLIAELEVSGQNEVIMVGAHLDSAIDSPGANNNGASAVALLSYARVLVNKRESLGIGRLKRNLRIAFWGAGEAGRYGSESYAEKQFSSSYKNVVNKVLTEIGKASYDALSEQEKKIVSRRMQAGNSVKLYIDLDSIASKNSIYGVYDGDLSSTSANPNSAYGSQKLLIPTDGVQYHIEEKFRKAFVSMNKSIEPLVLDNKADYKAFGQYQVPFGGLFSGGAGLKTQAQVDTFGGEPNQPFDPCHNKACDGFDNVHLETLQVNAQAMAEVVTSYLLSDNVF
ncbi:M28 family peptidase [Veronia pacifica]|uniref:Aminopeptidase n=1 Tax=Veronia pacifica TaxID=1080227 RepID=A0A1C3EKJ0_9GAMM|nr:M28 family peptidase [Veronia pacifica]ODA33734.1 hypothetical protein A8L45_08845 [Veronia pacifica]